MFHNGMSELTTLVQTCRSECYSLLYDLMEEWSEEQFANGVDVPTVTINVDMVDLSKTTDYADYQNLETIHLGDTVRCVDYVHHIATIERVVELTYDLLRGYNTSVTIGVANSTVGSMLSGSTGGGTASNNAINVDFIEQSLALKQPTLEAGKNITLTDNLDGTQTIASDKLIRAGTNVQVEHNADGSDTISASGGALTYWHETQQTLWSNNKCEEDEWHALDQYYFDYQVRWEGHIYSDRYYGKETAYPALIGSASISGGDGRNWGVPIIVSDKPEGVEVWGSYGGSHQQYQATFDYKGKTWYIGATNGYFENGSSCAPTERDMYGFYGFTPSTSQYYHAPYPDFVTAAKALIDFSELSFEWERYHGLARTGNLAFFAGAKDTSGTGAKIKIYSDGTTEGLGKVKDVTYNEDSLVDDDGIAILDDLADKNYSDQNKTIFGATDPTTEGVNGNTFIKTHGLAGNPKYLRLCITKNRGNDGTTQLSEVKFKDSSDNYFDWTGTTVTCNTGTAEGPMNLIDGNTGTKACALNLVPSESTPLMFTFALASTIDLSTYSEYEWYTANDFNSRDPVSWYWQVSEDGTYWVNIGGVEDATITTDRNTLAYEDEIDLTETEYGLTGERFYKTNDTWFKDIPYPFKVINGQLCIKYKKEVTS